MVVRGAVARARGARRVRLRRPVPPLPPSGSIAELDLAGYSVDVASINSCFFLSFRLTDLNPSLEYSNFSETLDDIDSVHV